MNKMNGVCEVNAEKTPKCEMESGFWRQKKETNKMNGVREGNAKNIPKREMEKRIFGTKEGREDIKPAERFENPKMNANW